MPSSVSDQFSQTEDVAPYLTANDKLSKSVASFQTVTNQLPRRSIGKNSPFLCSSDSEYVFDDTDPDKSSTEAVQTSDEISMSDVELDANTSLVKQEVIVEVDYIATNTTPEIEEFTVPDVELDANTSLVKPEVIVEADYIAPNPTPKIEEITVPVVEPDANTNHVIPRVSVEVVNIATGSQLIEAVITKPVVVESDANSSLVNPEVIVEVDNIAPDSQLRISLATKLRLKPRKRVRFRRKLKFSRRWKVANQHSNSESDSPDESDSSGYGSDENKVLREILVSRRKKSKMKSMATIRRKDKPTSVAIKFQNIVTDALLDSGASTTMVDFGFLKKSGIRLDIKHEKRTWRTANGSKLNVIGKSTVRLHFGTVQLTAEVVIAENLIHDVIVGVDVMEKHGFVIDYKNRVLAIGPETIKVSVHGVDCPERICALETINIPARSELKCFFTTGLRESPFILEAMPNSMVVPTEGLYVANKDGVFEVVIRNQLYHGIVIRKDNVIGQVTQVSVWGFAEEKESETVSCISGLSQDSVWRPSEEAKISENLTDELRDKYKSVIDQNHLAFSRNDNDIGKAGVEHDIKLRDYTPFKGRAYRLPAVQMELVEKHVQEMIEMGVIIPSQSQYASPIVLVKKADGSTRFCVDYRKLNELTIKDHYPLPLIEEQLDSLFGTKVFSSLDLTSGYWQFAMTETAANLTAFICHLGLFEFKRMPFGLCNAGSTFQRAMENLLRGVRYAMAYIDDVLVYSENHEDHLQHLDNVLKKLIDAGLKCKLRKCEFGKDEAKFLGYLVTGKGITISDEKTNKIQNYPIPSNARAVRRFNGLSSYFKDFIDDYTTINAPLQEAAKLTTIEPSTSRRVPRKFEWTTDCQKAFEQIKRALISKPILNHPDLSKQFRVITDASGTGLGAILVQLENEKEKVISYAGRVLTTAEKNYSASELELLAVKWAVNKYKCYLYGVEFEVFTDHKPLSHIKTSRNPSSRMLKWILELEEYHAKYFYRPGKHNTVADALSRVNEPPTEGDELSWYRRSKLLTQIQEDQNKPIQEWTQKSESESETVCNLTVEDTANTKEKLTKEQKNDQLIQNARMKGAFVEDREGTLFLIDKVSGQWRVVIPQSMRREILVQCHDGLGGSHLGREKTLNKVAQRFFWQNMAKDVREYVESCKVCNARKSPRRPTEPEQQPLPVVHQPFDRVAVDFVGPMPVTDKGNKYCLVFVDYASRWPEAFATKDMKASTVANILITEILCRHGAPVQLLSDRGANFLSQIVAEVCVFMKTHKINTSAYHPQTNGLVERFNGSLMQMVSSYVENNQRNWDVMLPIALFGYRIASQESTGQAPAELLYARQLRLPMNIDLFTPKLIFTKNIKALFVKAQAGVTRRAEADKTRHDSRHKPVSYNVGDLVRIRDDSTKVGVSNKLKAERWSSPIRVESVRSNDVAVMSRGQLKWINASRVKKAEPTIAW